MSNSILDKNQLKLIDLIGQIPTLYYPTFDSYLIDCGSTEYPNSQLFKNTCELRYLLKKIQRGSLEDVYPDLFTSGISIDKAIKLLSQFNIMFQSNISIDEIIKLISYFNIDFLSGISIDEVIKLISEFNILFNSNVSIDEVIKLISQFNIDFLSEISINEIIRLLSEFNILFQSNINIDEIIKLISEFNINFTSNISINEIIKLLSEFNILFQSNINIDEIIKLISEFNILFKNYIDVKESIELLSKLNAMFNSNISANEISNWISYFKIHFSSFIQTSTPLQILSTFFINFNTKIYTRSLLSSAQVTQSLTNILSKIDINRSDAVISLEFNGLITAENWNKNQVLIEGIINNKIFNIQIQPSDDLNNATGTVIKVNFNNNILRSPIFGALGDNFYIQVIISRKNMSLYLKSSTISEKVMLNNYPQYITLDNLNIDFLSLFSSYRAFINTYYTSYNCKISEGVMVDNNYFLLTSLFETSLIEENSQKFLYDIVNNKQYLI